MAKNFSSCEAQGLTLESGKHYSQSVEDSFHVSMAALELDGDPKEGTPSPRIKVMVQHQKKEFLLCSLLQGGFLIQQQLDLDFTEGEEVTFYLEGTGVVHLTGYLVQEKPFEPEDEPILGSPPDSSEDGMEVSGDENEADNDLEDTVPSLQDLAKGEDIGSDDDEEEDWIPEENAKSNLKRKSERESPKSLKKNKKSPKARKEPSQESEDSDGKDSLDNGEDAAELNDLFNDIAAHAEAKSEGTQDSSQEKAAQAAVTGAAGPREVAADGGQKKKKKKKKKQQEGMSEGSESSAVKQEPQKTPQKTPGKSRKKLSNGVIIEDTVVGEEKMVKPLKMVGVYYRGVLAKSKREFDSCLSGKPFRFRFGAREVISGWDSGLTGMRVGGKRRLTIPASQGYGGQRVGDIPAHSTLIFDIELKEVR